MTPTTVPDYHCRGSNTSRKNRVYREANLRDYSRKQQASTTRQQQRQQQQLRSKSRQAKAAEAKTPHWLLLQPLVVDQKQLRSIRVLEPLHILLKCTKKCHPRLLGTKRGVREAQDTARHSPCRRLQQKWQMIRHSSRKLCSGASPRNSLVITTCLPSNSRE